MMDSDGQYSDLCCPICYSYFSSEAEGHVPHMLKCGHTYCNQCLNNLISLGSEKCGECRTLIGYRIVKSIPVNYSVLRLIESVKNKNTKYAEFQEIEDKISNMIIMLDKNKEFYETRAEDNSKKMKELDIEKKKLLEIKQSLLKDSVEIVKSKSLDESLYTIKNTMEKMKKVEEQYLVIQNRIEKGFSFSRFQEILDSPKDFGIKEGIHQTTCFVSLGKIYVNSFSYKSKTDNLKYTIDYSSLRPFMAGSFMVIEYIKRSVLLEFAPLDDKDSLFLPFAEACMGMALERVSGIDSFHCGLHSHFRKGQEGESVVVGSPEFEKRKKSRKRDSGTPKSEVPGPVVGLDKGIRSGFLESLDSDNRIFRFRTYLEGWPSRSSKKCFGKMVRGGSILKSVLRNQYSVKVTRCGLIFDPVANVKFKFL